MWLALLMMLSGGAADRAPMLDGATFAKVQELKRIDFGDEPADWYRCHCARRFDPVSGKMLELIPPKF